MRDEPGNSGETPPSHPASRIAHPSPAAGHLVAAALAGSWRLEPPPLALNARQLAACVPLLAGTGAAGLLWRKASHTRPAPELDEEIRKAYHLQTFRAALAERRLVEVVRHLRGRGLEPLLVKGWAVGRLYPERGLRPYGDLDLSVHPDQFTAAEAALAELDLPAYAVDLHPGYPKVPDRSFEQLYARSETVPLLDEPIRIPGPEDHLRVLALHLLGHGAWRPLWLCDVAVAFEARPPTFDWEYHRSGDPLCAEWTNGTVALAAQVLGADVAGTPAERSLPGWLPAALYRQWSTIGGAIDRPSLGNALSGSWFRPGVVLDELRARWRNPIQATIELHAPFNNLPRWPLQLLALARRAPDFARQLAR